MIGGGILSGSGIDCHHGALAVIAALALGGCQPPPDNRGPTDSLAAQRGLAAMERVKCGACHDIPGVRWPKGRSGPALHDFASRGTIAGTLPNRPDLLAAFVRNAPAVKPGSPMPAMPISEREALDVAHALYGEAP